MAKAGHKKSPPTGVLKVHFNSKAGIDTGAMSQEFLAEVISDMEGRCSQVEVLQTLYIMFKMAPSAPVVRL